MARTRRTEVEKIEDAFFDMSVSEQEDLLVMLGKLHRLRKRQPEPVDERPAETQTALPMDS